MTYTTTYTANVARTAKAKTLAQMSKATEKFLAKTIKTIRKTAKRGGDVITVEMPTSTDWNSIIKSLEWAGYSTFQISKTHSTLYIYW